MKRLRTALLVCVTLGLAACDPPWHDLDHVMSCAADTADPVAFPECAR